MTSFHSELGLRFNLQSVHVEVKIGLLHRLSEALIVVDGISSSFSVDQKDARVFV
jgi:hypothetical protein